MLEETERGGEGVKSKRTEKKKIDKRSLALINHTEQSSRKIQETEAKFV